MKKIIHYFAVAALLVAPFLRPLPAFAAWAISGTDNLDASVGVALDVPDIVISGNTGTVPVKLLVTHGTLAFGSTTGLTFTGGTSGAELYFSGDVEDVNAALTTLTYTRNSTGTDQLEVSLVEPGEVFFSDNGHLYEYVAVGGGITWSAAQSAAAALTRYGSSGYLATITSSAENTFAAQRLEGAGWMGASDVASEGVWRWVTGPEAGTQFWSGNGSGSAFGGAYANWNTSEPNDSGSNEDCGQFLSGGGQTGKWNDLPCSGTTLNGYVVEFGAPGDMPDTAGEEFTITTYTAPTLSSVTPVDNAAEVSHSADLTMTFNQAVVAGTGHVTIYRSNGTVLRTIDITSGSVTGWGTSTITIDVGMYIPSGEYYVLVDATAIDAQAGGSYAGIASATAWSFSIARSSASVALPIMTGSVSLTEAIAMCNGESATTNVTLSAPGATEYLLSNDPSFAQSTWQSMPSGAAVVPWTFVPSGGNVRAYVAFRNTNGSVVSAEAQAAVRYVCDDVAVNEDESDGDVVVNDPVTEGESPRTGPSPWNGVIEPITDYGNARLIKGANYSTVYLIENGERRPFVAENIYFTWFSNFDDVRLVTDATLATIPLGKPVLPKASSLVKIQSVSDVFLVEERGGGFVLTHIPNEDAARERFGIDWAKRVLDIDPTLFFAFDR